MKRHELVLFVIHLLTVNALKVMLIKKIITIMFSCETFLKIINISNVRFVV